jgi:hypothetical protein
LEPSAGTAVDKIHELFGGQVQELVEIDTTVAELAESALSLGSLLISLQELRKTKQLAH